MAVLNQEIYIGSVSNPLYYFDKDHIVEPSSIQSVDLIEETLSIDTFEPTVLYDGTDYETFRTLPFGTTIWYYTSGVLTYKFFIKSVERLSKRSFKLNCISAVGILDKSYHSGGIYYGRSFGSLVREVISEYITDSAPEDSSITYNGVTITSKNDIITFNGTSSAAFIISFGPYDKLNVFGSVNDYIAFGTYDLYINSGDHYQIFMKLLSGTITKGGTTYNANTGISTGVLQTRLMREDASNLNHYLLLADGSSSGVSVISSDYSLGMNMFVYASTTFSNAKLQIFTKDTDALPYSMSEDASSTKIFGWLPYDTKRNNLHQMLFATNISILKDSDGNMYFDFVKTENPTAIDSNRIYIDGSIEYPAIPTEINLTEHSYQYDNNIEPENVIDNTSASSDQNGFYVFNNAPIVVETLSASEGIEILYANENYAIIEGNGIVTGVPYFDKSTIVSRNTASNGEPYAISVTDATLVTAMNSGYVADRLFAYYTSSRTVKGDVKLLSEKTGKRYSFTDYFGDATIGYLKKMTLYPSSFIKATCEFVTGYTPSTFGNMYEYHIAIEQPGTLIVPSGTKKMLVTMIGGGSGGSSGFAAQDPDIDWSTTEGQFEAYKNQNPGKGGEAGEPGVGGKIYQVLINNPPAGNWPCVLGLGGLGGEENNDPEENNPGTDGDDTSIRNPSGIVYSTSNNSAYRSDYGIMDLFTGVVYGRRGHIGCKGGDGGRGNTNGAGDDGQDVTFNGVTYYGGLGGDGVNFVFKRVERSANGGGAGGSGAQAFADGINGGNARITKYADATDAYTRYGYKVVETVGITGGWPVTVEPVYGYFEHASGDGGDAGHGGAGRGGYGGADAFTDAYTDTDEKKVWLGCSAQGGGIVATFSSPGLAAGDGRQGAIFIYSDKKLSFTVKNLTAPALTNTTAYATASVVTFRIRSNNSNDTIAIQRREVISESWIEIGRVTYASIGNHDYTDTISERGKSYEYRAISLGLGAAVDSAYSNSIITGYGGSKLGTPALTASSTVYGIHISWAAIANATSYVVAARPDGDYDWSYSITDQLYSDLFDDGYEKYYFKILAFREDGTYIASDWSNTVSAFTPVTGKVATPIIIAGNYTEAGGYYVATGITIKWDLAYSTCADYYRIERKLHEASTWEFITEYDEPTAGSYFDIFIVTSRQQWDYRIKGFRDGWIESEYSPVFTVTIDRALPSPTFVSLADSGMDYPGLTVSVTDIDARAYNLVWEVSVNGSDWVKEYTTVLGNGSIDPEPDYASTLQGDHIAFGGYIKVRCYITAPNYTNSYPSNVLDINIKERVFFYYNNTDLDPDPSGLTGGWLARGSAWSNTDTDAAAPTIHEAVSQGERSTTISSNNGTGVYLTVNEIDMSPYSKICLSGEVRKEASTCRSAFGAFSLTGGGYGWMSVSTNALALVMKQGAAYGTIENPSINALSSGSGALGFAVTGVSEYSTYGECFMSSLFAIKK